MEKRLPGQTFTEWVCNTPPPLEAEGSEAIGRWTRTLFKRNARLLTNRLRVASHGPTRAAATDIFLSHHKSFMSSVEKLSFEAKRWWGATIAEVLKGEMKKEQDKDGVVYENLSTMARRLLIDCAEPTSAYWIGRFADKVITNPNIRQTHSLLQRYVSEPQSIVAEFERAEGK